MNTATSDSNLEFLTRVKLENEYTHRQMAELTCYEVETVRAWFAPEGSTKFRRVPDRAVELAKAKMNLGAQQAQG